jgi:hypothetical protein
MSARDIWNERPVVFAEFSIKDGKALNAAFDRDSEDGSFMLLVLSLRYADTREPVFGSIDEVLAQPFRLRPQLVRLSTKAAYVNGLQVNDPDSPPGPAKGHDAQEAAGPPH